MSTVHPELMVNDFLKVALGVEQRPFGMSDVRKMPGFSKIQSYARPQPSIARMTNTNAAHDIPPPPVM